jgi:hypothetical protein
MSHRGLQLGDLCTLQEVAKREAAESHHEYGINETQLLQKPAGTRSDLTGSWIAVPERAAPDHIRDENVRPADAGAFEHPIQQSTRCAHEGNSLEIFGGTRRFPDEKDVCAMITGARDHAGSAE